MLKYIIIFMLFCNTAFGAAYEQIHDDAGIINDKMIIERELNKINEISKTDIRIYVFTVGKESIKITEKKVLDEYKEKYANKAGTPIFFFYKKDNNTYKFDVDNLLQSYVSPSYLQSVADYELKDGFSDKNLYNILARINTIVNLTYKNDVGEQSEIGSSNNVEFINFNDTAQNSTKQNKKTELKEKDSEISPIIIGSAIITFICFAVMVNRYMQKRKQNKGLFIK